MYALYVCVVGSEGEDAMDYVIAGFWHHQTHDSVKYMRQKGSVYVCIYFVSIYK